MTDLFKDESLGLEVWFEPDVLSEIRGHCIAAETQETGGILAGYYPSGKAVTISKVMPPTEDSVHRARTLDRGTKGTDEWLDQHRENSLSYVGEWHSHPMASPEPSDIDRETLTSIANDEDYANENPLMVIMGGDMADGFETSVSAAFRDDRPFTTFEEVDYP